MRELPLSDAPSFAGLVVLQSLRFRFPLLAVYRIFWYAWYAWYRSLVVKRAERSVAVLSRLMIQIKISDW